MLPLTKRQREILDYLNEFIQQHGYAPSLEEIGRRFNLSSLATVHKHLTNLQEKGFIRRAWNRSRSVELVPSRAGGRALELPLLGFVAAGAPIEAVAGSETIAVPDTLVGKRDSYVLRVKGRHLWNPSNFGICVLLVLAADTVASLSIQWGNYLPPMLIVWILGSLIIWRVKRFHICATYVIAFVFLAYMRSWVTGHPFLAEVAPITGPMYQLFIFFMVTDPKVAVRSKRGQILVVVLVAFVEMLLRLNEVIYAPFYALFLVGPAALLVEMWLDRRRGAVVPARSAGPAVAR